MKGANLFYNGPKVKTDCSQTVLVLKLGRFFTNMKPPNKSVGCNAL